MKPTRSNLPTPFVIATVAMLALALGRASHADEPVAPPAPVSGLEVKWGEGPKTLPPGLKMAVLHGKPSQSNMFSLRFKVPAGYKVPPHHHPVDEQLLVLDGEVTVGLGDKVVAGSGTKLKRGGFIVLPAGAPHWYSFGEETIIQTYAVGPWGFVADGAPGTQASASDGKSPPH
jgi:quercetin dioxygenase-like cupin family protein